MVSERDPGVEANARLTSYVGLVLIVLLGFEFVSGVRMGRLLTLHGLVGFFVIPPLLLKLGSVGYRFVRYYTGDVRYRAAGPPQLAMRLLAPMLVGLTVIVFVSGVELWLFGRRFGFYWIPLHHGSAYLWFLAMLWHVINYARRAQSLAVADWRDHLRGAFTRQSLVIASLVLGVALVLAMFSFPSPFAPGGEGS